MYIDWTCFILILTIFGRTSVYKQLHLVVSETLTVIFFYFWVAGSLVGLCELIIFEFRPIPTFWHKKKIHYHVSNWLKIIKRPAITCLADSLGLTNNFRITFGISEELINLKIGKVLSPLYSLHNKTGLLTEKQH